MRRRGSILAAVGLWSARVVFAADENAVGATTNSSATSSGNDIPSDAGAFNLPDGVTICDGSAPVGLDAAYSLTKAIPYCMHYGMCRHDYDEHPDQPCLCSTNFEGPHCEFRTGTMPTKCRRHCFLGECKIGAKSFELVLEEAADGTASKQHLQHCECGDRAAGEYCEREVQPCGDDGGHCLNGGTCLRVELEDGSSQSYCDCTTSYTGPEAFAGRYCQHKVTTFCSKDADPNGYHFCVNNGVCRDSSYMGCTCPLGFSGPLCEFKDEEVSAEYSACTLECQNNGVCRKGAKDVSFLEKFGVHRRLQGERFNDDFEHCVCPRGFVGLTCEYEMEVCPGREVVCMHGGECRMDWNDQGTQITCDCENAEWENYRFAGPYCDIRSTSFCTIDGEKTLGGSGYDAFCTNGGKCARLVEPGEPHPGCECSSGYYGSHCELTEPGIDRGSVIIACVVGGACVMIILVLVVVLLHRRQKRRRLRRMRSACSANVGYTDSAPAPSSERIHHYQPYMTTEASAFAEVKLHELDEVPLDGDCDCDEDEDEDDAFDERSVTCSYSPSDDTPTMTNVNYQLGFESRSLHYQSTRSRSAIYETTDSTIASRCSHNHSHSHSSFSIT